MKIQYQLTKPGEAMSPVFPIGLHPVEVAVEISIDDYHPGYKLKIGLGLSKELCEELVQFLSKNK